MDKLQAYHNFWSNFGWTAYDERSVPDEAPTPYITHETSVSEFDREIPLSASLWDMSTSWVTVTNKEKEIAAAITRGGKIVHFDGGAFLIRKGSPWAQRMDDESNELIRRVVLNLEVEFLD